MEHQLGVLRALVLVWVSSAIATAFLSVFVSPTAWALVLGSARHIDQRWGYVALIVSVNALLAGIGVTVGVALLGFRLSYPGAVLALAVGGILAEMATQFLLARTTRTADGIQLPALTPLVFSISFLLYKLLPAYIVNALASPRRGDPATIDGPPVIPPAGRSSYV